MRLITMRIRPSLVLAACVVAATGCSTAPRQAPTAADVPTADADSDAAWATLDPDQDGFLTTGELEAQHGMALLRDLWRADTDNDGRVSRQEWNQWWPRMSRTPPSPTMQALNASAATPDDPDTD